MQTWGGSYLARDRGSILHKTCCCLWIARPWFSARNDTLPDLKSQENLPAIGVGELPEPLARASGQLLVMEEMPKTRLRHYALEQQCLGKKDIIACWPSGRLVCKSRILRSQCRISWVAPANTTARHHSKTSQAHGRTKCKGITFDARQVRLCVRASRPASLCSKFQL